MDYVFGTSLQEGTTQSISNATEFFVDANKLIIITDTNRKLFMVIFCVLLILSSILNIKAILCIAKKNYRFMQKTCIISLALSDLLTTASFSANYLDLLSHPLTNWTTGSFMCTCIPMAQFVGVACSSFAILVIAIDRYRNIIMALNKRWDPKPWKCLIFTAFIWLICIALSFLTYSYYVLFEMSVKYPNGDIVQLKFCQIFEYSTDDQKVLKKLGMIYGGMIILVFAPIMLVFLYSNFKIAHLIWVHRKPVSGRQYEKKEASSTDNSATKTSTTTRNFVTVPKKRKQKTNLSVQRKIRTFKIIIAITVAFLACRLPYWIHTCLKRLINWNGFSSWVTNLYIIALNELSCILNPLLYTFLRTTINVLKGCTNCLSNFVCDICCCCCSNTDFEDYEQGDLVYNYPNKNVEVIKQEEFGNKKNRVKFVDSNHTNVVNLSSGGSSHGVYRSNIENHI